MITKDQINEIHNVACELISNVDEQGWKLKGNESYINKITKAVEDYAFENDYSQEQERELAIQVGL